MKQKLIIFLIKSLLPVEPKKRKAVIKAVFPDFHLRHDPRKKVKDNGANSDQL